MLWVSCLREACDPEVKFLGLLTCALYDGFFVDDQPLSQIGPIHVSSQFREQKQTSDFYSSTDKIRVNKGWPFFTATFPKSQEFFIQIMLIGLQFEQPMTFFLIFARTVFAEKTSHHRLQSDSQGQGP